MSSMTSRTAQPVMPSHDHAQFSWNVSSIHMDRSRRRAGVLSRGRREAIARLSRLIFQVWRTDSTSTRTIYRVIASDFPGFGFTEVPPERKYEYSFDRLAMTIDAFTQALKIDRYAIYVFDYGAPTVPFGRVTASRGKDLSLEKLISLKKATV